MYQYIFIFIRCFSTVQQKIPIHTNLDMKTYHYLKQMQSDFDINLNDAVAILVISHIEKKEEMKKEILRAVVEHVLHLYVDKKYFN